MAQDVGSEQSSLAGGVDGVLQALVCQRVLAPQVDESLRTSGRIGGDRHGLDHTERIALHEGPVLERAGLGLVRVADQIVGPHRLPGHRVPLSARGKGCAA